MIAKDAALTKGQLVWWIGSPSPVAFQHMAPLPSTDVVVNLHSKLVPLPRYELYLTRQEMEDDVAWCERCR